MNLTYFRRPNEPDSDTVTELAPGLLEVNKSATIVRNAIKIAFPDERPDLIIHVNSDAVTILQNGNQIAVYDYDDAIANA